MTESAKAVYNNPLVAFTLVMLVMTTANTLSHAIPVVLDGVVNEEDTSAMYMLGVELLMWGVIQWKMRQRRALQGES